VARLCKTEFTIYGPLLAPTPATPPPIEFCPTITLFTGTGILAGEDEE
jgi:hypothetical protein